MKPIRLYTLLIILCILCSTGCDDENYSKIVFMRGEAGSSWGNLRIIDYVGNNSVQLTDSGLDAYPRWSPLKDKIVFNRRSSEAPVNWDIYIINPDGSGETALITGEPDDLYPSWSPDGTKLAFLRLHHTVPGGNAIIVYDIDDDTYEIFDDEAITARRLNIFRPCWVNNGEKIAFHGTGEEDHNGFYTISYPAGDAWDFIQHNGQEPDWNYRSSGQSGHKIVYRMNGIRAMHEDGTNDWQVVDSGDNPKWSVKFDEIVFQKVDTSGTVPYTHQIYKVQESGMGLHQLTNNPLMEHKYPHW